MFEKLLTTPNFNALNFLGYFLFDQYDDFKTKIHLPPRNLMMTLRGRVNDPVLFETLKRNREFLAQVENISPLLQQYKNELMRILVGAPRLVNPLVVYRGFKSEAHLLRGVSASNANTGSSTHLPRNLEYDSTDFTSTSIILREAIYFCKVNPLHYHNDKGMKMPFSELYHNNIGSVLARKWVIGGVYEITLNDQIPCIYMEHVTHVSNEYEVLLPPGLHFNLDSKIHYKIDRTVGYTAEHNAIEVHVGIIHAAVRPIEPFAIIPYVPNIPAIAPPTLADFFETVSHGKLHFARLMLISKLINPAGEPLMDAIKTANVAAIQLMLEYQMSVMHTPFINQRIITKIDSNIIESTPMSFAIDSKQKHIVSMFIQSIPVDIHSVWRTFNESDAEVYIGTNLGFLSVLQYAILANADIDMLEMILRQERITNKHIDDAFLFAKHRNNCVAQRALLPRVSKSLLAPNVEKLNKRSNAKCSIMGGSRKTKKQRYD